MSRFEDMKPQRPVEDPRALVAFGWAPGGYFCAECPDCKMAFEGDKRCSRCQDCAEAKAAQQAAVSPAEQVVTSAASAPKTAADWIAEHERPDPNDAEAEIASLRLQLEQARSAPNLDAGVVGDLVEALEKAEVELTRRIENDARAMLYPDRQLAGVVARDPTVKLIRQARTALPKYATQGTGETWESMAAWQRETFGPVALDRQARRAAEEMDELLADPNDVEEAADVCIVLAGYPGIGEAINRKMAINRARKWRLNGDGTGYHVKADATHQPAISTDRFGPFSQAKIPGGDASNGAADHEGAGE